MNRRWFLLLTIALATVIVAGGIGTFVVRSTTAPAVAPTVAPMAAKTSAPVATATLDSNFFNHYENVPTDAPEESTQDGSDSETRDFASTLQASEIYQGEVIVSPALQSFLSVGDCTAYRPKGKPRYRIHFTLRLQPGSPPSSSDFYVKLKPHHGGEWVRLPNLGPFSPSSTVSNSDGSVTRVYEMSYTDSELVIFDLRCVFLPSGAEPPVFDD